MASWSKVPGAAWGSASTMGSAFGKFRKSSFHATGIKGAREMFGLGKLGGASKFMRGAGLAYLGYEIYSGYQEGGVMGAASNVAMGAAQGYAFELALSALPGLGAAAGVAAIGGAAYAYDQFSKATGRSHAINQSRMEMGSGQINDPFGRVSTMRRRSVRALQNSRLNGTAAMGNEAALSYTPYHR